MALLTFENLVVCLMLILALSLLPAIWRLLHGPDAADRLVAWDVLYMHGVGLLLLAALLTEQRIVLDVLAIIAVVHFLSVVACARSIEREQERERGKQ